MVSNHVADIVARYGEMSAVPKEITDYIRVSRGGRLQRVERYAHARSDPEREP
jgi:hypothetical protein